MFGIEGVGADPEIFVADEQGEIISGIGLIGGSKKHPRRVECGAVQEDNVLGEFNINPAQDSKEFIHNITTVMGEMQKIIGTKQIKVVSSHEFKKEVLFKAGDKATKFGCDPDYNGWTGRVNNPPSAFTNLRTGGGHVHVSFNVEDKKVDPFKAAAIMDYYLGLPSVLLDGDTRRRKMYGNAGACRPKLRDKGDPYDGVEYRTLSNFWIDSVELMTWVFNNTKEAISNLHRINDLREVADGDVVQAVINEGDVQGADALIRKLNIPMPQGDY